MRASCSGWGALGALSWLATGSARAEQFIVTDVTYTHAADNTSDSHYRVSPLPGTPTNWRSPIDYASGSVRVHLEVKTKPSDTQTRFQVCFEATPSYGCVNQSPVYTKPGTYEWTTSFDDFYYGGEVDWSKGVNKIALILKDANNNKPQGDPKFVPTDLRVEVALLTPGATYVLPVRDGGVADAGVVADAGRSDGSVGSDASPAAHGEGTVGPSSDASTPASDAATSASDAGLARPGSGRDAAAPPASSSDAGVSGDAGGSDDDVEDDDEDSGCSLARSTGGSSWFWSVAATLIITGYRRRRMQRKRAA